jgi:UDP-N-acetylglucosamine 2-epimerase (non-hydrolysing)
VRLGPVLERERIDMMIVQGDTTSALAAALLAFYRGIPVAHVEAGLRTHSIWSPYPEEMNRRLIGRLASLHFAPTERARRALAVENIPAAGIWVTGNTVIDALRFTRAKLRRERRGRAREAPRTRRLILVTAHRRESFGRGIEEICAALGDLVDRNPDVEIFFPVHPNPAIRRAVERALAGRDRIMLSAPLGYREIVRIMDESTIILTDSGGLQEEAPALGKPVVIMRDETERPEIVAAGGAVLAGPHRDRIVAAVERILANRRVYSRMARVRYPFGDGNAARRIGAIIGAWLRGNGDIPASLRRTAQFRP